jgi:uncharacterized protein
MTAWYRRDGKAIVLVLHIQPGAKHSEVAGQHGNEALRRFIAELFAVPLRNVELLRGAQSRHKTVKITGSLVMPEELAR